MVCKLVTEIKDHAKNFPNAPRTTLQNMDQAQNPTNYGNNNVQTTTEAPP